MFLLLLVTTLHAATNTTAGTVGVLQSFTFEPRSTFEIVYEQLPALTNLVIERCYTNNEFSITLQQRTHGTTEWKTLAELDNSAVISRLLPNVNYDLSGRAPSDPQEDRRERVLLLQHAPCALRDRDVRRRGEADAGARARPDADGRPEALDEKGLGGRERRVRRHGGV